MSHHMRRREPYVDPDRLFTRQEIAERTGLSDDVLSYWSRRGLLISEEGGTGKGVHRRFHYSQINIAVVLAVFRNHFGANIATLSSLADLLQSSVRSFRDARVDLGGWDEAATIGTLLHKFRSGETVLVDAHDLDEPGYEDLPSKERHRKRPAINEAEIIAQHIWISDSPPSSVIRFAESLGPGHETEARIAIVLLGLLINPRYMGEIYWLIRQTDSGWDVREGSDESTSDLAGLGPALFIPIVSILRTVWGIPDWSELRRREEAEELQERLANAGIAATVTPNDRPEDGFKIDAGDTEWSVVERALYAAGYNTNAPSENGATA